MRPRIQMARPSRRLARALVTGLLCSLLACAGPGAFEATTGRPPLRVGISPDQPPLAFRKDGELAGIEVDFAHELARALGRRVRFVELDSKELIPAVENGGIDVIMSGLSITPERAQRVLFATPYMRAGQLALIRSADLARSGSPAALRRGGARVGFVRDSTAADYVSQHLQYAEAHAFDSLDAAVRSLRAGRIDFLVHDAPTVWQLALAAGERELMGLYQPLTEEHLAWAVARANSELKARLDAVLDEWRRQGRLEPILDRWIPVRVEVGR